MRAHERGAIRDERWAIGGEGFVVPTRLSVMRPMCDNRDSHMTRSPDAPPTGLNVLVVDDNRDSAEMLQVLLGMLGHTVSVAHTWRGAVESVNAARPHVVLLDIGLPDMSGYDVAREIRASDGAPVPANAASSLARSALPADRTRCSASAILLFASCRSAAAS